MNYGPLLFLGAFLTIAASWCGLVLFPQLQFGRQEPVKIEETGERYPQPRPGLAQQGVEVYKANGCIYCHSQQVRPEGFGADLARNWGQRRTVSRDYLYDKPVMLGTMRTGPDLSNIGVRQTSVSWHLLHLYNPRATSKGSIMPSFRFLFEQRRIGERPSPNALLLTGEFAPPPAYEIVPKPEATALV
ncbi:MAG: cbb3-type cytochrome c oxidase subunit II, partial [Verrucomicrobia bacterium]|nr:cbb3-type cytochrome c oxidase subunit II [Verrucomicrobiota bacterium]